MTTNAPLTVGVLYPGEMGAALAAALVARGVPVVTTARTRSAATAARGAAGGAVVLDSFDEVVRSSDVLFSLVIPSAAEDVAAQYAESARLAPRGAIYVDANSIGSERVRAIAARVEAAGVSFVDASINGLAKNLSASGTLYLSGRRAGEVAAVCERVTRVKVLGDEPGRASAMKMLLGGLSKGVCALFAELAALADEQGMLDAMLEATTRTYPGVTALAERMLPTYARHAGRRATEMDELEATARAAGLTPRAIEGVVKFHEALAEAMPAGDVQDRPRSPGTPEEGRSEGSSLQSEIRDPKPAIAKALTPTLSRSTGRGGNASQPEVDCIPALAATLRLLAEHLTERETV
jgi:3-hydroxyisobutyrate dehydrogenase-like beta-hydroxyacid dehydrogenase